MILRASEPLAGGQAIVLGAGRCQEIPLSVLAERFPDLTLNDHDASLLDDAIRASGLSEERAAPREEKFEGGEDVLDVPSFLRDE